MIRLRAGIGGVVLNEEECRQRVKDCWDQMIAWLRDRDILISDFKTVGSDGSWLRASCPFYVAMWDLATGMLTLRGSRCFTVAGVTDPFQFCAVLDRVVNERSALDQKWIDGLAAFCSEASWPNGQEKHDASIESQDG